METKYIDGELIYICKCGSEFSDRKDLGKHWSEKDCYFWN